MMRCPIRSYRECPANLSGIVANQEKQVLVEICKNCGDPAKREVYSLLDCFWTQGFPVIAGQLAYYEVADKMMVTRHEAKHCYRVVL